MKTREGGGAGDNQKRFIAEPLDGAIPKVSMNVIIGPGRRQKKWNTPQGSQHQPDDDDPPRKVWSREELTNGEEIRNAGNGQRNYEGWFTHAAELARADGKRHK